MSEVNLIVMKFEVEIRFLGFVDPQNNPIETFPFIPSYTWTKSSQYSVSKSINFNKILEPEGTIIFHMHLRLELYSEG